MSSLPQTTSGQSRKPTRWLLLLAVAVTLAAVAVAVPLLGPILRRAAEAQADPETTSAATGYATPTDCLDGYWTAVKERNAARYLACLGEPLRSETRKRCPDDQAVTEELRAESGLKGWAVVGEPSEQGDQAVAEMEAVRGDGIRKVRFHLKRAEEGWLIVAIDRLGDRPAAIPHGTTVTEEP